LTGTFEEDFGQFHYWKGFPFDDPYWGPGKPVWKQLGEKVTDKMSKSVVSVASFKGDPYSCILIFFCNSNLLSLTNAQSYYLQDM
jgi:hypothetical protein